MCICLKLYVDKKASCRVKTTRKPSTKDWCTHSSKYWREGIKHSLPEKWRDRMSTEHHADCTCQLPQQNHK